ncbi:hypothetical protein HK104_010596 [Borealophlyctis nickersoniae]|nr:hypothetical protein HK104_010596 [Borealophlyctis nickersoniae]
MGRWFDNLPDSDHVPYEFIDDEPHIKDVVRFLRPADYALWGSVTFGMPGLYYIWVGNSGGFGASQRDKKARIDGEGHVIVTTKLRSQQTHWEARSQRMSPSIHPKMLPRVMLLHMPFYTIAGFMFAAQRSYHRFWGWRENEKEVQRYKDEEPLRAERNKHRRKTTFATLDW